MWISAPGTFYDHETQVGGGLIDMIMHLCNLERRSQAVNWLKEKGFLDGTFTRTDVKRPVVRRATTQDKEIDYFKLGLKWWDESSSIPYSRNHPIRRWCTIVTFSRLQRIPSDHPLARAEIFNHRRTCQHTGLY